MPPAARRLALGSRLRQGAAGMGPGRPVPATRISLKLAVRPGSQGCPVRPRGDPLSLTSRKLEEPNAQQACFWRRVAPPSSATWFCISLSLSLLSLSLSLSLSSLSLSLFSSFFFSPWPQPHPLGVTDGAVRSTVGFTARVLAHPAWFCSPGVSATAQPSMSASERYSGSYIQTEHIFPEIPAEPCS